MRDDYAPNTIDVVADIRNEKVCSVLDEDRYIWFFFLLVVSAVRLSQQLIIYHFSVSVAYLSRLWF